MKSNIFKTISKNLLFFILSKGVAFLAPIFFLKFVSLEDYGMVEYSFSMGSVAAVILIFGLNGAYPYFLLKHNDYEKEQAFYFYGFLILVIYILFIIFFYLSIIDISIYFIFLFSTTFALQRLYSSILKSKEKGHIAVLYDGGYYFILGMVIILCIIINLKNPIDVLRFFMEINLVYLIAVHIYRYIQTKSISFICLIKKHYPVILKYSINLVISGFIIYWLTSSSRIYIKYLMGFEQVGIYSFYFRIAGISVTVYMFCYITFFKKLYLSDNQKLDSYFFWLMLVVLACCLICYAFFPFLIEYFFQSFKNFKNKKLLLLLCFQMPIWVGIALNEGIISRENILKQMNVLLLFIVILFPIVLYIFKQVMTLELFTILNIIFFCIALIAQIWILKKKNIFLQKCLIFNIITFITSIIIYIV